MRFVLFCRSHSKQQQQQANASQWLFAEIVITVDICEVRCIHTVTTKPMTQLSLASLLTHRPARHLLPRALLCACQNYNCLCNHAVKLYCVQKKMPTLMQNLSFI